MKRPTMTDQELTWSMALVAMDLQRQVLLLLMAKGVISATEATHLLRRTRAQCAEAGKANAVFVIDTYFNEEINKNSWVQRDKLATGEPEGSA